MNQEADTPAADDDEAAVTGSARLNEPTTEAEREGIVDQQGALIAEMQEDSSEG